MGLLDWAREVRGRYREQGVRNATVDSLHELYIGGLRRLKRVQRTEYETHWERDWDILCILDACRTDLFRDACDDHDWLPDRDEVETIWSTGSSSLEWMETMFGDQFDEEMGRTAYVTGNLFVDEVDGDRFAHLELYQPRHSDEYDIYTVPPSVLTDAAIRYWREGDADRLIVHYMQPHTPFRSRPEWFDSDAAEANELRTGWGHGFVDLRDGKFSHDEFVDAYRDNLDWVLEEVNRLRRNADGQLALSADHGNGLGEWGVYGHPDGINTAAVREVPFATVTATDTGESQPAERSKEPDQNDVSEGVEDRLRRLGYKT